MGSDIFVIPCLYMTKPADTIEEIELIKITGSNFPSDMLNIKIDIPAIENIKFLHNKSIIFFWNSLSLKLQIFSLFCSNFILFNKREGYSIYNSVVINKINFYL